MGRFSVVGVGMVSGGQVPPAQSRLAPGGMLSLLRRRVMFPRWGGVGCFLPALVRRLAVYSESQPRQAPGVGKIFFRANMFVVTCMFPVVAWGLCL